MKSLNKEGCSPKFHQLDITSLESIQKFKTFLEQEYGGIDILINNAGIAYKVIFSLIIFMSYLPGQLNFKIGL